MFAICVEASHQKGLGHLFRCLNVIDFLKSKNEDSIVFINDDPAACAILESRNIPFEIVELSNFNSGWEVTLAEKYGVHVWINDRLDTDIRHAKKVTEKDIKLITLDDRGSGAELSDINFGCMPVNYNYELKGQKVFKGVEWLILNKEIERFKRKRTALGKILVSLGGSDTYGATVKVVRILKELDKNAAIITGPSFEHTAELENEIDDRFMVKKNVPSLIEEFYEYDLAITGGGITPFEANASGLPCIIVANEHHEVENARFMDSLGSSVFAGHHEDLNIDVFSRELDIESMSRLGMAKLRTDAVENIYGEISRI